LEWLVSLRDARTVAVIRARLNRIRLGNSGNCRSVGGGVEELRIDFGPGYRVYYGHHGAMAVIVLGAGDKKTQEREIRLAQSRWREYLNAKTTG
jgi:putative addiction module killer protein